MTKIRRVINWDNLKPYESDQKKSFEELCYQIVSEEFKSKGVLTSIDDSGGGDGVEFYITRPNGEVWGWQCKFFGRFDEGGRKEQIKKSLRQAYAKHGKKLKKWILCSKLSLTVDEKDWFENRLASSQLKGKPVLPSDHSVLLEHWGNSIIQNYLRQYPDIYRYFFSEKSLTPAWFQDKAAIVLSSSTIQAKYIHELHIESYTEELVVKVLGGKKLADLIKEKLSSDYQIELSPAKHLEQELETATEFEFPDVAEEYWDIRHKIEELVSANKYIIGDGTALLIEIIDCLASGDQTKVPIVQRDVIDYLERLTDFNSEYSKILEPVSFFATNAETDEQQKKKMKECLSALSGPYTAFNQYYLPFERIFSFLLQLDQKELHIAGNASKGKTHLAVNIFKNRIDAGEPAVLLLGRDFKSNSPLGEQIKQLLDIPSDWSLSDFLGAMNTAAKVRNTKAILLIDGLNESVHWKEIWDSALENLVNEIKLNYSNLLLITTYRTSYEEQLFPENYFTDSDEAFFKKATVDGFDNFSVHEAVEKYFKHYNITLTGGHSNTLYHFSEPLYLKIFCETKKGQTVSITSDDLFEVLDQYLQRCNENILKQLNREFRYNQQFVRGKLLQIAGRLWTSNSREIALSTALPDILSQGELAAIEHEDLLVFRDWNRGEVVSFTYDLLSGYMIATTIVDGLSDKNQATAFISSSGFADKLLRTDTKHPLYNDILRCFFVLAVKKFGITPFETVSHSGLIIYLLRSLYEINAAYIKQNETSIKNFIWSAFRDADNREQILILSQSVEFDPGHPLNFKFTSCLIKELSVADRDLSWTEFIRKNYSSYDDYNLSAFLRDFEKAIEEEGDLSERIHLAAEKVKWLLTSTNRELRDTATRALYYYGRRFAESFVNMVFDSLTVNDPYVWERTLASLYGVAMAEHTSFVSDDFRKNVLPEIGRKLYGLMFSENAPHATTHILAGDYAKRTVDICLLYHRERFTETEIQRLKKPYQNGIIEDWQECNFDHSEYDYAGPIHMDFSNYTIGTIVRGGGSYADPPEKQRVRRQIYWRIFDLGWEEGQFKEAEQAVNSRNHVDERPKVERYGKKYSWIAFYEVAGYRDNLGLLDKSYNEFRISEADIDPSFPEKPRNEAFIQQDISSNKQLELKDWYLSGEHSKVKDYLSAENLSEENAGWICLDAFDRQSSSKVGRERIAFVRGLLVKEKDYQEFLSLLRRQKLRGWLNNNKGQNYYSFAGELYYCPEATYDNYRDIEFTIETKKEKIKIGDPDSQLIMRERPDGFAFEEEYPEEIEREVRTTRSFNVLCPVMEYNWETYHSVVNQAGHETVVAKELAAHLGLVNQPQTFNLFDKMGKKASVTISYHDDSNSHSLVYLRKDSLDKFLAENGFKYVWAIWGEKRIHYDKSDDFCAQNSPAKEQHFQEIIEYNP